MTSSDNLERISEIMEIMNLFWDIKDSSLSKYL